MFQPFLFQQDSEALSVSDVNAHIKAVLEEDDALADVRVQGEVSNFKKHTSGHVYFTLRDSASALKCVMWRTSAIRLRALPRDGERVVARGRVGVYERDGAYQLYCESLTLEGAGNLYAQFELLKQKLAAEGLFDETRKRPLPAFPRVIGIATSPTGAALQDVLNILRRRFPLAQVVLAPAQVQGDDAPPTLVRAIRQLNETGECDVILVARGGGSAEDLWPFNDERVVRAVAGSAAPAVSGVGHEIDFTLTDFAADVRAPTPSAAAELITPDINDLRLQVDGLSQALTQMAGARVSAERERLISLQRALRAYSPIGQIARTKERVADLRQRLHAAAVSLVQLNRARLDGAANRLNAIGPQATLARGYAIVTRENGAIVRSVRNVKPGDNVRVRVSDGTFVTKTIDDGR